MDKVYIEANARRMHPDLYADIPPSEAVKELIDRYRMSDEFALLSEWFAVRDIPLPWSARQSINVTVSNYDSTSNTMKIDTEATKKVLARIVQKARQLGYGIEKSYSDDYFHVKVIITEKLEVTYSANRQTVCKRIVVGKKLVPERYEDVVEYDCERIALSAIEVD